MVLLMLVVYAAFMPTINEMINALLPSVDSSTGVLLRLIPLYMVAVLIIGIFYFGQPG